MKNLIKVSILSILLLFSATTKAQILITLLFGEKLNTPKIEFGLIGGLNRSFLTDIADSEGHNHFNLGFYFHVNVKDNSFISTGVWVKYNVGAKGMPLYSIGNADFDDTYKDGTLTKKISCFYLPVMFQYRFNNRWYLEAGPQGGLRTKANDIFKVSEYGGDLTYTKDVKDEYALLDFGFVGGAGYKFKQQIKSMAVGVSYYYGLVNIIKTPDVTMKNSSLNFYMKIPLGTSKKPEK